MELKQNYMILDEKRSAAFRKTINGFMPKHVNTKLVFQCLSLPQSSNLPRKIKKDLPSPEEEVDFERLKVTGRELQNNFQSRSSPKNTRIKTIRVVMQNPQKMVNALVDSSERQSFREESMELQKVQSRTPKQIITLDSKSLYSQGEFQSRMINDICSRDSLEKIEEYEQLIVSNPELYKKVMLAYNASKRQHKDIKKISIRKIIQRKQVKSSRSVPKGQPRFQSKNTIEFKKNANYLQAREFQLAVNLTNHQVMIPPQEILYKAYICKGNNGLLVKSLLKSRPWWSIRGRGELQSCNLIWTEWKRSKTTKNLPQTRPLNQKEDIIPLMITPGAKMRELRLIVEKKQDQVKKIAKIEDSLWRFFERSGTGQNYLTFSKKAGEQKGEQLYSYCSGKGYDMKRVQKQQKMVNHVPGCLSLHSKKLLFHNLKRYYEQSNKDIFSVLPLTFHITKGTSDPVFLDFLEHYDEINRKTMKNSKQSNVWIIKPGQNSNRGVGISVSNKLADIRAAVEQKCRGSRSVIVQKYMESPFLYNKRKFDIRCYILITTVSGIVKGYWYEQGYIRTSSKEYNLKHLNNKYVHLTNDSIQQKGDDYGKFENFNKVSYQDFEKYVEAETEGTKEWSPTLSRMKEIATDLIHAVATQLNPQRQQYCFEIFGLDFMLDTNLNPFLIQANSNPCITVEGSVLARVIPSMLQNVMKVAIDPIFPPPSNELIKNKYCFSNPFQSNKLVLVYDSFLDERKLSPLPFMPEAEDEELLENQEELDAEEP